MVFIHVSQVALEDGKLSSATAVLDVVSLWCAMLFQMVIGEIRERIGRQITLL